MKLSVILPTYNEAGNIIALIKEIASVLKTAKLKGEIIVVDDDSSDGTAKLVVQNYHKVEVIVRKKDRGLAKSILEGIRKSSGNIVLVMDTDFNHDPKEIPKLVAELNHSDLVIGSRYIKGGGMENRVRYWLSYLFNIYIRILLGSPAHDNLSGYFAAKRLAMLRLPQERIFYGFGDYFIRLIYYYHMNKARITEVPVYYKNRSYGASKSRFLRLFMSYTYYTLKLRFGL